MKSWMKNWKTTLAGLAALLTVAAKLLNDPSSFEMTDVGVVAGAIGLLKAKDGDVTGGTRPQTTPASVVEEAKSLTQEHTLTASQN